MAPREALRVVGEPAPAALEACADGALGTREAVTFSGIGRSRLFELAREGRVRVVKFGGRTLWPRRELARVLAEHLELGVTGEP